MSSIHNSILATMQKLHKTIKSKANKNHWMSSGKDSKNKDKSNTLENSNGVKVSNNDVTCTYGLTLTKFYLIILIWLRYGFEVYISYFRQFKFVNSVTTVPEELTPFYSKNDFEEAKIQFMFTTFIDLENKYNTAVHLSVVYLTNVFCTLWWIAGKLTNNRISRAVMFNLLHSVCLYRPGDVLRHINLIITSYSLNQGVCRLCDMVKDVIVKSYSYVSTMMFIEEVLISILLTLMTTPMCVIMFLTYRLYKTFIFPRLLEERPGLFNLLEEGELNNMIKTLCSKFNIQVTNIYVSNYSPRHSEETKIVGTGNYRYLVLGRKLVDGYQRNEPKGLYSMGEIAATILRAHAEYSIVIPSEEFTLEVTKWATTIIFTIVIMFGFCGGSRLGFSPSPPHLIAFIMSKHLAIPIFLIVQIVSNTLRHKRHFALDEKVAEVGFGDYLISYIAKEARSNYRFPVEDPVYTYIYSERPPALTRIRNLNYKIQQYQAAKSK